jgi:hypothetical protein
MITSTDLTDDVVEAIASGCPSLENVDLSSSPQLTEKGVVALAQNCCQIYRLCLLNCEGVGPKGVQALAKCPKMKVLNLQNVRGVTSSLSTLTAGCEQLETLHLDSCFLTDDDVAALAALKHLRTLHLNNARGFDSRSLEPVLPLLHQLMDLSLGGNRSQTAAIDSTVCCLIGLKLPLLKLDLNRTKISKSVLEQIQAAYPMCSISTVRCQLED